MKLNTHIIICSIAVRLARIINSSNTKRLAGLIENGRIYRGGETDPDACYVAPTILDNVTPDDPVMLEEIFGPVLPVISFDDFEEIYGIIKRNPKPLATYIFTRNKQRVKEFLMRTESGSAAINETVMQIANPHLPYGGVGCSGMGRYHGKKSFETFSIMRSILVKSNLVDLPLRYPPYTPFKEKIVRWFLNSGM